MASQIQKKLDSHFRSFKCTKKGCLSQQIDAQELVWFGKQYQNKQITCSSCFVMNDEALKKSIPSQVNIVPISSFIKKFTEELKAYEINKASNNWQPKVLKGKQKQLMDQMNAFQVKLSDTLKSLIDALSNLVKKAMIAAEGIYQNKIFDQIIQMNNKDNFDTLLEKILILISFLNVAADSDHYRFQNVQLREKRIAKLNQKNQEICAKTIKILEQLFVCLKQKNDSICKI